MIIYGVSFISLAIYYWTMSITPGPNNVMLTMSGANFGFRKTIPHIFGIGFGCSVQTFLLCLGLGVIFSSFPLIQEILKWVGVIYLIYLALKLVSATTSKQASHKKALSFWDAAIFQFVNPKAWVKATTTATIFLPAEISPIVAGVAIFSVCMAVNLASSSTWAIFGVGISKILSEDSGLKKFNYSMAALLVATAFYVVYS